MTDLSNHLFSKQTKADVVTFALFIKIKFIVLRSGETQF